MPSVVVFNGSTLQRVVMDVDQFKKRFGIRFASCVTVEIDGAVLDVWHDDDGLSNPSWCLPDRPDRLWGADVAGVPIVGPLMFAGFDQEGRTVDCPPVMIQIGLRTFESI